MRVPQVKRRLYEVADEIGELWDTMPPDAAEWVEAMSTLDSVTDPYYEGTGGTVVANFLEHSSGWLGEDAARIKGELAGKLWGLRNR